MVYGVWCRQTDGPLTIHQLPMTVSYDDEAAFVTLGETGWVYKYFRGSARRPSMALATTVAGLARKIRASREPMRPW